MDISKVVKVALETDPARINAYLATGRWIPIVGAPGQTSSGEPYVKFALGWLGKKTEDDTSEFPEMPKPSAEYELWT